MRVRLSWCFSPDQGRRTNDESRLYQLAKLSIVASLTLVFGLSSFVSLVGKRQIDPAALVEGLFDGVDRLLHPGAIGEIALVALAALDNLIDEIFDQVGIE